MEGSSVEMLMERPPESEIQSLLTSLNYQFGESNITFDNYLNTNNGSIYKSNKQNYISQYNSLGEKGEMILFHGTDGENLKSILLEDFRLTNNPVNGTRFGKGIYFTNNINKAMNYSEKKWSTKYILVCIVHIGDIVKGEMNMDIHPLMSNSEKRYDTSVDDVDEPRIFIKKKNGTYNILGVLTIKNCVRSNSQQPSQQFDSSFTVINNNDFKVEIYWIPDDIVKKIAKHSDRDKRLGSTICPGEITYSFRKKYVGRVLGGKKLESVLQHSSSSKILANKGDIFASVASRGGLEHLDLYLIHLFKSTGENQKIEVFHFEFPDNAFLEMCKTPPPIS